MQDPKNISFLRQCVEITIVIILSLLIVEICLRVYFSYHLVYDIEMEKYSIALKQDSPNSLIDHVLKPNTTVKLMGVWVHTNADGFRGKDYPIARTSKKRIIFLGNSFLLGWGVKEGDTFKDILEKDLSQIYPTEIINAGMVNYNTEQETHLFIEKGLKYHPDKVVLFWAANDVRPIQHKSKWWIFEYSELVTLCWSFSHIIAEHVDPSQSYQSYYADLFKDLRGVAHAQEAFLLLKNICQKHNIALQVIIVPDLHNLANYAFKKEQRMFEDFFKSNGIEVLDLTPFLSNWKDPVALWVSLDDPHPNKIAHQLFARYMVDFIKKGLYDRGAQP